MSPLFVTVSHKDVIKSLMYVTVSQYICVAIYAIKSPKYVFVLLRYAIVSPTLSVSLMYVIGSPMYVILSPMYVIVSPVFVIVSLTYVMVSPIQLIVSPCYNCVANICKCVANISNCVANV